MAIALTSLVLGAGGCGSDGNGDAPARGSDGEALAAAFEARAVEAYQAQALDRDQEFADGVMLGDCFAADATAIAAIGDRLGIAAARTEGPHLLSGAPGEEERLSCTIESPDDEASAGLTVGTTLAGPEELLERALREEGTVEIDDGSAGLDPDSVIATARGDQSAFLWSEEKFAVAVIGSDTEIDPEQGFAALETAVSEVERTLTSEE